MRQSFTVQRARKILSHQASLVIFEVFLDTFVICTMSVLLVLVTGTWQENILPMHLVQVSLGKFFPYMHYFMPFFLFLLGYTTVITYFAAGVKTAEHLAPKYGRVIILFLYYCHFVHLFLFRNHASAYCDVYSSGGTTCPEPGRNFAT